MQQDDLDRILSKDPEIIPSSGFVASVMDSVRSPGDVLCPVWLL